MRLLYQKQIKVKQVKRFVKVKTLLNGIESNVGDYEAVRLKSINKRYYKPEAVEI